MPNQLSLRGILNDLVNVAGGIVIAPGYTIDTAEQQIRDLVATAKPKKQERPLSGPQRNGTAQAVRKARNNALDEYEVALLRKLEGKSDV